MIKKKHIPIQMPFSAHLHLYITACTSNLDTDAHVYSADAAGFAGTGRLVSNTTHASTHHHRKHHQVLLWPWLGNTIWLQNLWTNAHFMSSSRSCVHTFTPLDFRFVRMFLKVHVPKLILHIQLNALICTINACTAYPTERWCTVIHVKTTRQ